MDMRLEKYCIIHEASDRHYPHRPLSDPSDPSSERGRPRSSLYSYQRHVERTLPRCSPIHAPPLRRSALIHTHQFHLSFNKNIRHRGVIVSERKKKCLGVQQLGLLVGC